MLGRSLHKVVLKFKLPLISRAICGRKSKGPENRDSS